MRQPPRGASGTPADEAGARPGAACPTCGKPATQRSFPFCSARCADVDLQRWLSGAYAIPVAEGEAGAEEEQPAQGGEGE